MRLNQLSCVDHNRHLDFLATFSDTLNIVEDGEDIASLDTVNSYHANIVMENMAQNFLLAYCSGKSGPGLD